MAKTAEIKIPDDIEYRVIGNLFGFLIASAGLLAGEMLHMRSLDYWQDDIVPILLLIWLGFRLFRNFLSTMNAYQNESPSVPGSKQQIRETLKNEQAAVAQIASKTGFTAEQVVEEVAKRIEAKKTEAMKKIAATHGIPKSVVYKEYLQNRE